MVVEWRVLGGSLLRGRRACVLLSCFVVIWFVQAVLALVSEGSWCGGLGPAVVDLFLSGVAGEGFLMGLGVS